MRANGTSSYDLLDGAPLADLAKPTQFANLCDGVIAPSESLAKLIKKLDAPGATPQVENGGGSNDNNGRD